MELDILEKTVLKAIEQCSVFDIKEVVSVYEKCKSFDKTVEILRASVFFGVSTDEYVYANIIKKYGSKKYGSVRELPKSGNKSFRFLK